MGQKSSRYEEEVRFYRCDNCGNNIPVEFYYDQDDTLFCDDCSSEYMIQSRRPLRLILLEEDYDGDFYGDLDFD